METTGWRRGNVSRRADRLLRFVFDGGLAPFRRDLSLPGSECKRPLTEKNRVPCDFVTAPHNLMGARLMAVL